MKFLLAFCAIAAFACEAFALDDCTADNCKIEDGCACVTSTSPIDLADTPQLVLLSFDDAVTKLIYKDYIEKLLFDRQNPDKKPISATFFVPHEYTDYTCVNSLYNKGFEIAAHSISKSGAEYWQSLTKDELVEEFKGQKQIISTLAIIPADHIQGARTPFFQLAGDKTFAAYVESDLSYDSSWPAAHEHNLYPYTLEYKSSQDCWVGECPKEESYPNFWVSPINNIAGNASKECSVVTACEMDGTVEVLKEWLIAEFEKNYKGNRAPFNLLIPSAWFQFIETSFDAFSQFLDHLATLDDVFIVSHSQAIAWRKNMVTAADFDSSVPERNVQCKPVVCVLEKSENEIRYMSICGKCPAKYPWVGNPDGNK